MTKHLGVILGSLAIVLTIGIVHVFKNSIAGSPIEFDRIEELAHVYTYKCPNAGFAMEVVEVKLGDLGVYPGVVVHKDGNTYYGYCLSDEGRWYIFYHDLDTFERAHAHHVKPGSVPEPVYLNLMNTVYGNRIEESENE